MFVRTKEASCNAQCKRRKKTLISPGTSFSLVPTCMPLEGRPLLLHVTDRGPNKSEVLLGTGAVLPYSRTRAETGCYTYIHGYLTIQSPLHLEQSR